MTASRTPQSAGGATCLLTTMMMMMMMTGVLSTATPAARDDAPVRSSERRVAQSVEDRVDRAVDIAQPVP